MNVLIICNCITEKCIQRRHNIEYMAASSRKKLMAISNELEKLGHNVDLTSASFSKYCDSIFIEYLSKSIRIIHAPTIGFFGKTSFFKKTISIIFNIVWLLFHLRHYQAIIIYNYHIEFSLSGLLAKLFAYIKIVSPFKLIMDYEDGLFLDKGYKGFFYLQWEKLIYKFVDTFLLVNENLKYRILKFFPEKQNFIVINGFIDCNVLDKNNRNINTQIKRIVFSGNFTKNFGFEQLLEYLDNLPKSIVFDITGKASNLEVEELKSRISNLTHIHYHGFLEEIEFNKLIQNADAFVLLNDINSPNNNTNFPSKFFDYLSRNKYIITSENPILKDYYDINNIILLTNFPDDIKRINEIRNERFTNYLAIKQLSEKIRNNLSKLLEFNS